MYSEENAVDLYNGFNTRRSVMASEVYGLNIIFKKYILKKG